MSIYTEVLEPGHAAARDFAVHQTLASANAWLKLKLSESGNRRGRFYGKDLTLHEIKALKKLGPVESLP
jgi:hypothetical protein